MKTVWSEFSVDGPNMRFPRIAKMPDEPLSTVHSRFCAAKRELLALLRQRGVDDKIYSGTPAAMLVKVLHTALT